MANWLTRKISKAANWVSRSLEDPSTPMTAESILANSGESFVGDAGANVTPTKALGYAPLNQAVSMISGDCAKLPLNVYSKTDRGRSVAANHPVQKVIHRYGMANEEVNGYKFWRRYYLSALLWGNAYAWIDRSNRGEVLGLYQLLPDRTWLERTGGVLYCMTQTRRGTRSFLASDCLCLEGLSIDGLSGAHVVKMFRQDFSTALAAKQFEARFFKNNMSAGGILQVKAGTNPAKVKKTKEEIEKRYSGSDAAFKTLVIRDQMQWISTQVDPQKAQLPILKEDQVREVARMYNLPPSRLGLKDSQSYNSGETDKANYYDGALSHWLIANSAECTTKLLTQEERAAGMYCEYNVNALLWADALTRNTIAITGMQAGRFNATETRGWENLDSYEGSDTYYYPLNLQPIGTDSAESERFRRRYRRRMLRSNRTKVRAKQAAIHAAYRNLLEDAFTRAINRACIRAERGKSLDDDRANIVGLVDNTFRNVVALVGLKYADGANKWFDSLIGVDASSLRAHAEASSREIIEDLFKERDRA